MWVSEDPEYTKENAMLIEEFLHQRILGMKNEKGVYVTPAFPKLLYVLDEDNIHEDSEYYYLTKLAAQCTAKRMVPDYISAKKMREYKYGISQDTGLVIPGLEDVFKKFMLARGYAEADIDLEIEKELKLQKETK